MSAPPVGALPRGTRMPTPEISAQEQLMIELLNRARLDPLGEAARYGVSLNQGLAAGTISSTPMAPLASNMDLSESAAGHSSWMLAADVFSHTGAGGSNPGDRMAAAGYRFLGSWSWGENISWWGSTGTLNLSNAIAIQYKNLFLSPGHRVNFFGDFREVGVAQEAGGFTKSGTTYNASMVTQNFGKTGVDAFITGVAFQDADNDRFYDVGEGRSGVVVDWLGNAASTGGAGGYNIKIPLGLTGTAAVSVTVNGTAMQATLGMTGTNVKLDVVNGRILASSTDLTLGQNAVDGRLLGIADRSLAGNDAANLLEGNRGANVIRGMGGDDTLKGGAGADTLIGASGQDTLLGGGGADDFVFHSVSDSAPGSTSQDVINKFAKGSDDIVVSGIDANEEFLGNQSFVLDANGSFSAGEIRQTLSGSTLLIEFNTDSDSAAEMAIQIRGVTSALASTDFIL